jgi:hypothetical protein
LTLAIFACMLQPAVHFTRAMTRQIYSPTLVRMAVLLLIISSGNSVGQITRPSVVAADHSLHMKSWSPIEAVRVKRSRSLLIAIARRGKGICLFCKVLREDIYYYSRMINFLTASLDTHSCTENRHQPTRCATPPLQVIRKPHILSCTNQGVCPISTKSNSGLESGTTQVQKISWFSFSTTSSGMSSEPTTHSVASRHIVRSSGVPMPSSRYGGIDDAVGEHIRSKPSFRQR